MSDVCIYFTIRHSSIYLPETGLNPYDVRRTCNRAEDKDGPLCYKQMQWIEEWMNNPANKAALGVDPTRHFASCNMEVNQAFTLNGDGMHNSALLLPELVDAGVRLLVYAGNAGEFSARVRFPFRLQAPSLVELPLVAEGTAPVLVLLCTTVSTSIRYFVLPAIGSVVAVTRCMTGVPVMPPGTTPFGDRAPDHTCVVWCTLHVNALLSYGRGATTRSLFSEHV